MSSNHLKRRSALQKIRDLLRPHKEAPQQETSVSAALGPVSRDDSISNPNASGSLKPSVLDYDYSSCPLPTKNSIRLLHLLPPCSSDPPDTIRCTLNAVPLSTNPTYRAVSYTWGEPVFPYSIHVEDMPATTGRPSTSKPIHITSNLHALLLHFRHPTEATFLWVDAICINQHDTAEKSTQIPLMADIYALASEVLIWLGASTAHSDSAMAFLRRVGRQFLKHSRPIREPREDANDAAAKAIWDDLKGDPALDIARTVWDAPWFGRRWVIQELVFAKKATVHFGGKSMNWEELARGVEAMRKLGGDGSFMDEYLAEKKRMPPLTEAGGMMRIKMLERMKGELRQPTRSRITTMALAADFECRDGKDRLFALLSIMNHGREDQFAAYYGLPTSEIFERFAWYCLEKEHPMDRLDILSYAGLSNLAQTGTDSEAGSILPSWVPGWHISVDNARLPLLDRLSTNAGDEVHARTVLKKDSKELVISGVLVDPVIAVLPPLSAFSDPGRLGWSYTEPDHAVKWYATVEAVFTRIFGPYGFELPQGIVGKPYIFGGTAWEALFRTMVLDPQPDELVFMPAVDLPARGRAAPAEAVPFYEEGTGFRRQMLTFLAEAQSPASSPRRDHALTLLTYECMEYHARVRSTCECRSLLITLRGMIGLGPSETQLGDIICLPAGASVPYMLRPEDPNLGQYGNLATEGVRPAEFRVPDRNIKKRMLLRATPPRYRLVGECYVQGLMRGEAWKLDDFFMDEFALY